MGYFFSRCHFLLLIIYQLGVHLLRIKALSNSAGHLEAESGSRNDASDVEPELGSISLGSLPSTWGWWTARALVVQQNLLKERSAVLRTVSSRLWEQVGHFLHFRRREFRGWVTLSVLHINLNDLRYSVDDFLLLSCHLYD